MSKHRWDPLNRCHHLIIESEEIERLGVMVRNGNEQFPASVVDDAVDTAVRHQFALRDEVNAKRLAHFRHRFGPGFTTAMLPRSKP